MTVLIVDDNPGVRRLLRRVVQPFAVLVLEACNGSEAVKSYRERQPTVVLMDVSMPEMDGLSATKAIRDLDPEAKVIVVTDFADADTRLEAQRAGARALVSKLDVTALEDLLVAML